MTVWEFRALVRAYRGWLGCRCPLGVGLKAIGGGRQPSFPSSERAGFRLNLTPSFAYGVATGWDGGGTRHCTDDEAKAGHRYGRRLRRAHYLHYLRDLERRNS